MKVLERFYFPFFMALFMSGLISLTQFSYADTNVIGILEPNRVSSISNEVIAVVETIYVNIGDVVKGGDLLAQLNAEDYSLQVRLAESEVALSQAEYNANERQFTRIKGLQEKGNTSISLLDDSEKLFAVSLAQLNVAKAKLDLSKNTLQKTNVLAPYDAWVSARNIEQGQLINTSSIMFELVDIQKLKVVFYLLENDLSQVSQGDRVEVSIPALNEIKRQATIVHIAPQQFSTQPGYRVEAMIANSDYVLRPGFTVRISLPATLVEVTGE